MLNLSFEAPEKAVREIVSVIAHIPKGAEKAMSAAINDTLRNLRGKAVKLAQARYTAKAADLRRRSAIKRATAKKLQGRLTITGKRGMGLINFQAQPASPILRRAQRPSEGATVKVLKSGSRKAPRKHGQKAFAAKGESGNVHLFVRTGKGKGDLEALYGPHPISALYQRDERRELDKAADHHLQQSLRREVDKLLTRSGRGKG